MKSPPTAPDPLGTALELDKVSRGPHLSTVVASSIAREIAEGRLRPGDQLPSEQALAATFGVSRNVVREAIARLRSENRIWSRQGRGAFVCERPPATVLTIDPEELQSDRSFSSLFELRGILEGAAAALAARRRLDEDLESLRQILAGMAAVPYGSVAWLRMDLDFHGAIATATRNVHMARVLAFVSERVRDSILASGHRQGSHGMAQMTLLEHRHILDAIVGRDAPAARDAMRRHLAGAAERVGLSAEPEDLMLAGPSNDAPAPPAIPSETPGAMREP
ncbi:MAG TPA: FadR/GntR family transcriptional regulator [Lichenihabitans sp.]|nr:FadR/GntR family transcriptional regulator [Lichenihabitans sp.]